MKVYMVDSAAKLLGLSRRQFLRIVKASGRRTDRMGSRQVYLFTEKDIQQLRELRAK